jgi:hypothetical protein
LGGIGAIHEAANLEQPVLTSMKDKSATFIMGYELTQNEIDRFSFGSGLIKDARIDRIDEMVRSKTAVPDNQ